MSSSIFDSVLGSFRRSFEDPHAHEHELPRYRTSPPPRIPPPIASTVLHSPFASVSLGPRLPDDVLALQRAARDLEASLQDLLDAQSDALMRGLGGDVAVADDLETSGSVTPTVSSLHIQDGSISGTPRRETKKRAVSADGVRRAISKRIQRLESVKNAEMELLEEDLTRLDNIVGRTVRWTRKRTQLVRKIEQIEAERSDEGSQVLQREASQLEHEIRQKEAELLALKRRHRSVLDKLSATKNSVDAEISSYKQSLEMLDKDVAQFIAMPPVVRCISLPDAPFRTLPPKRRTLEMAHDYWHDEYERLADRCKKVQVERAALEEGAQLWDEIIKKVSAFEKNVQEAIKARIQNPSADSSHLLAEIESTIEFLEKKMEHATSKAWNLLICAIGTELEAFKEGKVRLQQTLINMKGAEKTAKLVDAESPEHTESEDDIYSPIFRHSRSPPKPAVDIDNGDPDPDLILHHDTDTD